MQYDPSGVVPYGRPTVSISDELRYFLSKPRDGSVETEPHSSNYWVKLNPDVPVKAEDMPKPSEVLVAQASSCAKSINWNRRFSFVVSGTDYVTVLTIELSDSVEEAT